MEIANKTVGFAMTGSFCTIADVVPEVRRLVAAGAKVIPILSPSVAQFDTRFGKATDLQAMLESITHETLITTIPGAEPIGPRNLLDILIVAPCTGNTLAKIANGITDTSVTMAVKAHLRNNRPVVLSISTNDGLGANAKNIGLLLNTKNIYFVPFCQDDPLHKNKSVQSKNKLIQDTLEQALEYMQIQPVLI